MATCRFLFELILGKSQRVFTDEAISKGKVKAAIRNFNSLIFCWRKLLVQGCRWWTWTTNIGSLFVRWFFFWKENCWDSGWTSRIEAEESDDRFSNKTTPREFFLFVKFKISIFWEEVQRHLWETCFFSICDPTLGRIEMHLKDFR